MDIVVVRSGGVAGMTRRAAVDTATLGDAASEWEHLVQQAIPQIVDLPAQADQRVRDAYSWTLKIGEHRCETPDSALTGAIRELAERTLREGRRPR